MALKDEQILDMIFNNRKCNSNAEGEFVFNSFKEETAIDSQLLEKERIAIKLAENNEFEAALNEINEVLGKRADYGSGWNNKAQILRMQDRDEEALQALENALLYGGSLVLKQAYTQKGVILEKQGKHLESEEAFRQGALYGNSIAKSKVQTNPYAKMCNAIISEILTKEKHNDPI